MQHTHTDMALKGSLDILYHYYMCRCAVKTVMLHRRHRLKLAIPMINQIHHSTDGSRGVKVFCQCFYHAGFSFSQPDGTQDKFSPISWNVTVTDRWWMNVAFQRTWSEQTRFKVAPFFFFKHDTATANETTTGLIEACCYLSQRKASCTGEHCSWPFM